MRDLVTARRISSARVSGYFDERRDAFGKRGTDRKTLRSTNVIERLHGEFRRHVKTQGSQPTEDAAVVLLFSLVASGQIKLRMIDGWRKIAEMLSEHTSVAA